MSAASHLVTCLCPRHCSHLFTVPSFYSCSLEPTAYGAAREVFKNYRSDRSSPCSDSLNGSSSHLDRNRNSPPEPKSRGQVPQPELSLPPLLLGGGFFSSLSCKLVPSGPLHLLFLAFSPLPSCPAGVHSNITSRLGSLHPTLLFITFQGFLTALTVPPK